MIEAAAVGRSYLAAWQTVINIMELSARRKDPDHRRGGHGRPGCHRDRSLARRRADRRRRRKPDGVEHFIDTSTTDLREAVLELTDGRGADLALDTVGGALFEPVLRSLRFDGRLVGIFSAPEPRFDFSPAEIYNRQLRVTGLASVFMDGADAARIFDQLRALFDRGILVPPAVQAWPLERSVSDLTYITVLERLAWMNRKSKLKLPQEPGLTYKNLKVRGRCYCALTHFLSRATQKT